MLDIGLVYNGLHSIDVDQGVLFACPWKLRITHNSVPVAYMSLLLKSKSNIGLMPPYIYVCWYAGQPAPPSDFRMTTLPLELQLPPLNVIYILYVI